MTTQPFRFPEIVAEPDEIRFSTIELLVGNRKSTVSPDVIENVVQSMMVRGLFSVTSSSLPLGEEKVGAVEPCAGLIVGGTGPGRAWAVEASRLAARATTGAAARAISQARRL